MRAESIQAIINAQVKAMALNSALQRNCGTTAASTVSRGTPTETSQGARWAVEEPVMRSTPSGHVSNSLPSLLTRWLAMRSKFARADPMRTVEVLRDDDSALVDDPDDAAGRKPAYPQGVLEMLQPRAGGQNRPQPSLPILDPSRDIDDPLSRVAADMRIANCETPAAQDLAKVGTINGICPPTCFPRAADVLASERKERDAVDEIGQFRLDLPQQGIVGKRVGRIRRHGATEPGKQMLEVADVVVNLGRQNSSVVERALPGGRLGVVPLAPKAGSHECQKRHNGGKHQSQQLSSDAAQQCHAARLDGDLSEEACNRRRDDNNPPIFPGCSFTGMRTEFLLLRLIEF